MAKSKKFNKLLIIKKYLVPVILSVVLLILTALTYLQIMSLRFYPLTYAGDTNISFLTKGQAIRLVQAKFQNRQNQKINFASPGNTYTVDLATASATLDFDALIENFNNTHTSPVIFLFNSQISPQISLNLDKQLDVIASSVEKKPENAKLTFTETPQQEGTPSSSIQITESIPGIVLDKQQVKKAAADYLISGKYQYFLPLKVTQPKITTDYVTKAKTALEKSINNPLKLTFENKQWFIDTKQLLALLDLENGEEGLLDKNKTKIFLSGIASEIDQNVIEGLFEFNPDTKKVTAFKPSQEGRKLDTDTTFSLISDSLNNGSNIINLPVAKVLPKIQTEDINSLGIKELLGKGVSNFAGSIANRIYNVGLAASRVNGVLVPPGQTFSFNQTIGDISAATGYKQAYVIKEGRTVLDDGGGVCQVSTTLFRAVLNAGLPVVQRTAHAYRVSYYEQGYPPGLDATVFYPSVDFQFKNDTPAHILIQAYTQGTTIYFDLYGTSDGRVTNLTKPVIANQTPPPPELRQDDPTLPKGTIKQVDWAAWGANVSFKRTVERNGQTLINETWKSNYKPWQAVFLVGTQ